MKIREAKPSDEERIRRIHHEAFEGEEHACSPGLLELYKAPVQTGTLVGVRL